MSVEYWPVSWKEETAKATLYTIDGQDYWVPKSQIVSLKGETLEVTDWWAENRTPVQASTRTRTAEACLRFSAEQQVIVDAAIEAIRTDACDMRMPAERAIEFLCADYLAGR